ncbi:MAG: magnesium chelatase subunit D [Dokdonella sp.]|uniref:magnesium chelatase subunit D n=1 Tax=Dokdonella sp. TaxID=2291710 RepID=UPI003265A666
MSDADDEARWADAALAAALIAINPTGLRGACIRAPHGHARDRWLGLLRDYLPPVEPLRRVPVNVGDERLLGGLDLAATLGAGRAIAQRGILADADGGFLVLPMAERFNASTLAHIAAVLDTDTVVLERNGLASRTPARIGVIALDEAGDDEEPVRASLLDRLPFLIDLSGLRAKHVDATVFDADAIALARTRLARIRGDDLCEAVCSVAMKLGVASVRASIMAIRAACALAALHGRAQPTDQDAACAVRLVLAPRAAVLPEQAAPSETRSDPPPAPDESGRNEPPPSTAGESDPHDDGDESDRPDMPLDELLLAATVAAIPRGLLQRLRVQDSGASRARTDGRAGALRQSMRRGRPAGTRPGDPSAGIRLNLVETLRAAAPWQPLRRAARAPSLARRVEIRRQDFHVTRYRQRTQTTTIFVVDASGSSAINRLAEAKGAVELLLADCYVRRDQVAVIGFRGTDAELLLPPTRSLIRAKRSLAGLPGGGGTPLAAAIDAGIALAEQVKRAGHSATLVLLTDGRANIARDGSGNRERAESDARAAASRLRAASITTLFLDTSPRPQVAAALLAAAMDATYLPLPYADAASLSSVVKGARAPARR